MITVFLEFSLLSSTVFYCLTVETVKYSTVLCRDSNFGDSSTMSTWFISITMTSLSRNKRLMVDEMFQKMIQNFVCITKVFFISYCFISFAGKFSSSMIIFFLKSDFVVVTTSQHSFLTLLGVLKTFFNHDYSTKLFF